MKCSSVFLAGHPAPRQRRRHNIIILIHFPIAQTHTQHVFANSMDGCIHPLFQPELAQVLKVLWRLFVSLPAACCLLSACQTKVVGSLCWFECSQCTSSTCLLLLDLSYFTLLPPMPSLSFPYQIQFS